MTGKHVAHDCIVDHSRKPAPLGRIVPPLAIGSMSTEWASDARLARYNATLRLFGTQAAAESWAALGGRVKVSNGEYPDDETGATVHRATVRVVALPHGPTPDQRPEARTADDLVAKDEGGGYAFAPPKSATQHVGRQNLKAEYRGLGIDPALIDIIESAGTLAERVETARATGYRMREGKAYAPCVVEPAYETGIESPLEPVGCTCSARAGSLDDHDLGCSLDTSPEATLKARLSARNWRAWLGGRA